MNHKGREDHHPAPPSVWGGRQALRALPRSLGGLGAASIPRALHCSVRHPYYLKIISWHLTLKAFKILVST